MSLAEELTYFLGLEEKQIEDNIFIAKKFVLDKAIAIRELQL
jgi:hypothetical protein